MNFVDQSLKFRQEVRRFVLGLIHPQTLASESARASLNVELKEHWKPQSIEIYELILENWVPVNESSIGAEFKDDRFIVYIDQDFEVDWIANGEISTEAEKAISFAESIGAKRCKHLPREQTLEFKRLVGQAIVNGIRGEKEYARELANEAAQFLKDRTVERSRSWTLTSAHLFLLLFSAALILSYNALFFWQTTNSFLLWLAIQGGIIGAYLSIVSERSKPASGERMKTSHFEERIAFGAVETAQRRDESTQRELATFDNGLGGAWLVPPADCA